MSAAALTLVLCATLPAQTSSNDNLDLHTGTLDGWRGKGFYVTTANPRGPSLSFGLCSSDRGSSVRTGVRRYTFTVPSGTKLLRCTAYVARHSDSEPDDRLNVVVITASNDVLPMQVSAGTGWRPVVSVLPRQHGMAREYTWDLSAHGNQKVQVVVRDDDERPGSYLFCGGFRLSRQNETAEFVAQVRQLETKYKLLPLTHYQTKHFAAWSNAEKSFTENRLRNCETMYAIFLNHFRSRGFTVQAPASKLMVAVFDSQGGFEACLGQRLPSLITGVYNRASNQLVLYDLQQNERALAFRQNAFENSRSANDLARMAYLQTVQRQVNDWSQGGSLSTAMHETAHHLSFNCGLLNRHGDVPLWLGEGLACYCEATDRGGWQGLGEPNHGRIFGLADVLRGKSQFLPLKVLVQTDNWRDNTGTVLLGYAQSWALFRMLMHERPAALNTYLRLIYSRRTPDHRLTDFAQVFGSDLARMERHYFDYMTDVVKRNAARLRQ